ncbi:hypothetical protein B0H21DRAFT_711372 [Amylocystis lapponica]|nr:hypothetical protein B0H21DRAFT_711372 [Amylocystis lapponica]
MPVPLRRSLRTRRAPRRDDEPLLLAPLNLAVASEHSHSDNVFGTNATEVDEDGNDIVPDYTARAELPSELDWEPSDDGLGSPLEDMQVLHLSPVPLNAQNRPTTLLDIDNASASELIIEIARLSPGRLLQLDTAHRELSSEATEAVMPTSSRALHSLPSTVRTLRTNAQVEEAEEHHGTVSHSVHAQAVPLPGPLAPARDQITMESGSAHTFQRILSNPDKYCIGTTTTPLESSALYRRPQSTFIDLGGLVAAMSDTYITIAPLPLVSTGSEFHARFSLPDGTPVFIMYLYPEVEQMTPQASTAVPGGSAVATAFMTSCAVVASNSTNLAPADGDPVIPHLLLNFQPELDLITHWRYCGYGTGYLNFIITRSLLNICTVAGVQFGRTIIPGRLQSGAAIQPEHVARAANVQPTTFRNWRTMVKQVEESYNTMVSLADSGGTLIPRQRHILRLFTRMLQTHVLPPPSQIPYSDVDGRQIASVNFEEVRRWIAVGLAHAEET